ncbi:MAG TPA: adenosylcobinamide-GDP ribazoletransferase [Acidimicrobiia bacterium]|jgi:adenosylcobinamide-GDP ribazoletransferase
MRGFRLAVSFLTRIPAHDHDGEETPLGAAPAWFGVTGGLIGLMIAGVYALAFRFMPSLLASLMAVGGGVWLTRALHEDGLADTADALGSGASGQAGIEVMSDPRVGAFGAIALVFSVIWRVLAVATLSPVQAVAGLVVAHALSRSSLVALMTTVSSAKPEGMAASVAIGRARGASIAAGLSGLVISGSLGGFWVLFAVIGVVGVLLGVGRVASRRFGGITGDVLGAGQQLGEMVVLGVVAAAAWRGWVPWWTF